MSSHSFFRATLNLFSLSYLWPIVIGNSRLIYPPPRGSIWMYITDLSNLNNTKGLCSENLERHTYSQKTCGVCGDPWSPKPRPHERGGNYYNSSITTYFKTGSVMPVEIEILKYNNGFFEFRICPYDIPEYGDLELYENGTMVEVTNTCLDRHLLRLANGQGTKYFITKMEEPTLQIGVKLPENLNCKKCLFQWRFQSENHIHNTCADIVIEHPMVNDKTDQSCYPTSTYSRIPRMYKWCHTNCKLGYCPATHCQCR